METSLTDRRAAVRVIQQAWSGRGWLACLVWPLSQLYALAIRVRSYLYLAGIFNSVRVAVPVIVVGNVVVGGGGKTPLVISLARRLKSRGVRVGVISRGYGRKDRSCLEVFSDTAIAACGDEPALIKRATGVPVFVARERADAAAALLEAHPKTQLLICDDGLQHDALQRDIDIVVFDDRGIGNGWLLPAGPLREPWPTPWRNGPKLVLHTGQTPAFKGFTSSRRLASHAFARDGSSVLLDSLTGQPLAALAAIARPDAFFNMLRSLGLPLEHTISLPDHHDFSDIQFNMPAGSVVLCTEKDAVKLFALPAFASIRLLAVPLEFEPEPAFLDAFDALLAPLLSQLPSDHGHKTS